MCAKCSTIESTTFFCRSLSVRRIGSVDAEADDIPRSIHPSPVQTNAVVPTIARYNSLYTFRHNDYIFVVLLKLDIGRWCRDACDYFIESESCCSSVTLTSHQQASSTGWRSGRHINDELPQHNIVPSVASGQSSDI